MEYILDDRHRVLHSARLISHFPQGYGKMRDDGISLIFVTRKPRFSTRSNCLTFTQLPSVEQHSHVAILILEPASNRYILFHSKTFCVHMNWFGPSTPGTIGTVLMCCFWGGNLFL